MKSKKIDNTNRKEIIQKLCSAINKTDIEYVILRYSDWKINNEFDDIDFFVSNYWSQCLLWKIIIDYFQSIGGYIYLNKNDHLCTTIIIYFKDSTLITKNIFVFEIRNIYIYKHKVILSKNILEYRYQDSDGIYKMKKEYESIFILFRNILIQRELPKEYKNLITIYNKKIIPLTKKFLYDRSALNSILIENNFKYDTNLKKILYKNIKNTLSQKIYVNYIKIKYIIWAIRNLKNKDGQIILILGPDWSWKSTISESVASKLNNLKIKTFNTHFYDKKSSLYNMIFTKKNKDNSTVKRISKKSPFINHLRQIMLILNGIISYYIFFKYKISKGNNIIFDRYYTDIFLKNSTYNLQNSKIAFFLLRFIPKPSKIFILKGEAETIIKRKNELSNEEIISYYENLDSVIDTVYNKSPTHIDINLSIEEITDKVIFETLRKNA